MTEAIVAGVDFEKRFQFAVTNSLVEVVINVLRCFGRKKEIIKHYKIQNEVGGAYTEIFENKNEDGVAEGIAARLAFPFCHLRSRSFADNVIV